VPTLRRGFALDPADRAFVVEDVVTTGGSVHEVLEVVRAHGAAVAGVGAIVRRAPVDFGVPTAALLDLPIESFPPESCPQCAAGEPLTEPGSRFLKSK
jgi:orotate phosphoribosyltransferase